MHEAMGGDLGATVTLQLGVTGSLFTYAQFRKSGFNMRPFCVSKMPRYGGIFIAGMFGALYGRNYVMEQLGDKK
jgi:hypothetical protein